eukprot:scaffold25729_cov137-Cylindrotheca_fusiformis.AAC.7
MESQSPPSVQNNDDDLVPTKSLADQARRNWIEKDKTLVAGTSHHYGSSSDASRKNLHSSKEGAASPTSMSKSFDATQSELSSSRRAVNHVSRNVDNAPLGSSVVRGSKVYRIDKAAKTATINNFLPRNNSSTGRSWIRKPDSDEFGGKPSKEMSTFSGISLEDQPETSVIKTSNDSNDLPPSKHEPIPIPFDTPCEEEEYDDEILEEYDDEILDLNDKQTVDTSIESEGSDTDEDLDLEHAVDRFQVREYIVDKVPKKPWTSENIQNFPIWPPVIKVRSYEMEKLYGDFSGVSIGSGFTDDDFLTDGFSSDEDASIADRIQRQAPDKRTSYRIRYDGPTNLNLDSYKMDNRFQSECQPHDGAPNMPSRATDSAPTAPPRRQSSTSILDELDISVTSTDEPRDRPDVWITALSGDTSEDLLWNVRRVWDLEEEDNNEKEHSIHNRELLSRIKSLVGATERLSALSEEKQVPVDQKDEMPQMPTRSWQIQKVVERRGKLEHLEPGQDLAEEQVSENIRGMAEAAVVELKENAIALEAIVDRARQHRMEKKKRKVEADTTTEEPILDYCLQPWPASGSEDRIHDLLSKANEPKADEFEAIESPLNPPLPPSPPSHSPERQESIKAESPLLSGGSSSSKSVRKGRKDRSRSPRVPRKVKEEQDIHDRLSKDTEPKTSEFEAINLPLNPPTPPSPPSHPSGPIDSAFVESPRLPGRSSSSKSERKGRKDKSRSPRVPRKVKEEQDRIHDRLSKDTEPKTNEFEAIKLPLDPPPPPSHSPGPGDSVMVESPRLPGRPSSSKSERKGRKDKSRSPRVPKKSKEDRSEDRIHGFEEIELPLPPPTPPSHSLGAEESSMNDSPLLPGGSSSVKSVRRRKKDTSSSPRVPRKAREERDQSPRTPMRHPSNAKDTDSAAPSPTTKSAKQKSRKKKKSKKKTAKEKKQISVAEMYLAASSSDSEDDTSSKKVTKAALKEKSLDTSKRRRKRGAENTISPAAMVQDDSSVSDSNSSGGRSPSEERDPQLPSSSSTPWWKKQGVATPKHHTPKRVVRPSLSVKRTPLSSAKNNAT